MQPRLVFLLVFFAPAAAFAQQLVTFDEVVTITEKGNGSGGFHYTIKPAATEPASWTAPVNYAQGTAHLHLEVMQKPSKRTTAITICFDGNLEGYGCLATNSYTDVGTYDTARSLPSATWQYGKIAWGKRRQEYHLVVKDPALGGTPGGKPASDYVPTTMRIVMTIVPPGGTYMPPPGAAAPATDAGASVDSNGSTAPDAGVDPAPSPADAAIPPPGPASDAGSQGPTTTTPPPSGEGPGSGTPAPSKPPAPPATGNPAPKPPAASNDSAPVTSGGCNVAAGRGNAGGAILLAAALLTALGRRRRRD